MFTDNVMYKESLVNFNACCILQFRLVTLGLCCCIQKKKTHCNMLSMYIILYIGREIYIILTLKAPTINCMNYMKYILS